MTVKVRKHVKDILVSDHGKYEEFAFWYLTAEDFVNTPDACLVKIYDGKNLTIFKTGRKVKVKNITDRRGADWKN